MKLLIHSKNINGCTEEIWEWISNSIPHFKIDVLTYSGSQLKPRWHFITSKRVHNEADSQIEIYFKGHWFAQLSNVTSGWQPGRRSCNHPFDMSPPNAVAGDKHETRLASSSSSFDFYQSNTRHQMCHGRMVNVYGVWNYGDNDNDNFFLMLVAECDMQWLCLISNLKKKSLQLKTNFDNPFTLCKLQFKRSIKQTIHCSHTHIAADILIIDEAYA